MKSFDGKNLFTTAFKFRGFAFMQYMICYIIFILYSLVPVFAAWFFFRHLNVHVSIIEKVSCLLKAVQILYCILKTTPPPKKNKKQKQKTPKNQNKTKTCMPPPVQPVWGSVENHTRLFLYYYIFIRIIRTMHHFIYFVQEVTIP